MTSLRTPAIAVAIFAVALSSLNAAVPAGAGDPVVNVGNSKVVKLRDTDGAVLWSVSVSNDGALAVDPADLSVYTGLGGHAVGTDGAIYKFNAAGQSVWTNSITLDSYCDFEFVSHAIVDAGSANPGVIWGENGCFGALAKSDRATGTQQWSVLTYDISRPAVDPTSGQIYAVTDAGLTYDAETIYSVTAGGALTYAESCEGHIDVNPADGTLYRGGGDAGSRGCGTVVSQMNRLTLGATNWTIDLSNYVSSIDSIAVQPWQGGYVYAASVASSKIVVVDPTTQSVVNSFNTAIPPTFMALDPNTGNVYVANNQRSYVVAYGPTGALVWINPNLGGNVTNLATARVAATAPSPTPTPTPTATPTPTPSPSATPDCPVPTVKIVSDRNQLREGDTATINLQYGNGSAPPCQDVTVHFKIGDKKVTANVDYTLTDANGDDATATGTVVNGPLFLRSLFTSRIKNASVTITLLKDKSYYLGAKSSVSVKLQAR